MWTTLNANVDVYPFVTDKNRNKWTLFILFYFIEKNMARANWLFEWLDNYKSESIICYLLK